MSIAGDEVDRTVLQIQPGKLAFNRCPPLTGGPHIANMRATQHTQGETLFMFADKMQIMPEEISPDDLQALPIIRSNMQTITQDLTDLGKHRRSAIHRCFEQLERRWIGVEQV